MKLSNGILRPGIVLEVLDDGKIKASAPGLFSEQDKKLLPPIYPFTTNHANSFSSPVIGEEVWVLNLTDNPLQLYWFRKDNFAENDKKIIGETNVEVLCNRETSSSWATLYFSDGSGWIIKNDESVIQIDRNGDILLSKSEPHRTIHINDDGISIGSKNSSSHPAAYGDVVVDALNEIKDVLGLIQKVSLSNAITAPIAKAIGTSPATLSYTISKIESKHVTID